MMSQYNMWAIGLKTIKHTSLGLSPQYIERYKNGCLACIMSNTSLRYRSIGPTIMYHSVVQTPK
jgi:hypothetical protein